jgi:hypothetical protein
MSMRLSSADIASRLIANFGNSELEARVTADMLVDMRSWHSRDVPEVVAGRRPR